MLPVPDPCDEHELFFEDVNSDAGFTLFLEALTSENVCTDVTATCSVRRAPSKHSMKANFQPKVFELVSEGSIAAEATAHDIAGDVSTELSSLPTAEEYRLKKLREKNRRTQQAYRNRQKERHCSLQAAIEETTQKLEDARIRWRDLRSVRSSLQQRMIAALQHPHIHSRRKSICPECSKSADIAANLAGVPQQLALGNFQSQNAQLVPKTAPRSPFGLHFSPFTGADGDSAADEWSNVGTRPISSFTRCEALSMEAISVFLDPNASSTHAYDYHALAQAIDMYQQSVSNRTGVPVADICWFQQWRFPGLEPHLSFTSSASSPECCLCATLCFLLASLEAMFLVVEHDMLLEASDSSYEPPDHPSLHTTARLPSPPLPADPKVLNRTYVRCGVNQMIPVKQALERTLKPLLAEHRARLPAHRWSAVCIQTMRITQAMVYAHGESHHAPADSAASKVTHDGSGHGQISDADAALSAQCMASTQRPNSEKEMRWEDLTAAAMATNQHLVCCIYEALQQSMLTECAGRTSQGRTLSQVQNRMVEVMCTFHTSMTVYLQVSPITSRRMIVSILLAQSQNILRASRQNIKLFKQLQLQPDQRSCMAERWHSWRRRRAALSRQLVAALARFEEAVPAQGTISTALMRCATLVATSSDPEPPLDTDNQGTAPVLMAANGSSVATSRIHMHAGHVCEREPGTSKYAGKVHRMNLYRSSCAQQPQSVLPYAAHDVHIPADYGDCPIQRNYRAISGALQLFAPVAGDVVPSSETSECMGHVHDLIPQTQNMSSSSLGADQCQMHDGLGDSTCMYAGTPCMHLQQETCGAIHSMPEDTGVNCDTVHPIRSHWASGWDPHVDRFRKLGPQMGSGLHAQHSETNSIALETAHPSAALEDSADIVAGHAPNMHAEQQCMHAPHELSASAHMATALRTHGDCSSYTAETAHACQECMLCGARMTNLIPEQVEGNASDNLHDRDNECVPCIVCGRGKRQMFLGESGEVAKAAYDALGSVLDVHTSDALMHFEFVAPSVELTEKQQTVLMAAVIDLGQPTADITALWQIASEEERREALFGHLTSLFI